MEIELRIILLGVGLLILLVVGFDFFKRKPINDPYGVDPKDYPKPKTPALPNIEEYAEPDINLYVARTLGADTAAEELAELEQAQEQSTAEEAPPERIISEKIITISIMSRDQYGFNGADLIDAFEAAQLEFGQNDVFHRYEGDQILFSIVNAVEPGYFIIETLAAEHVPGITLILLPEQVENPLLAFDKFIRTAKQVAFALNGELFDRQRQPLTLATIEQYRKEIPTRNKRK